VVGTTTKLRTAGTRASRRRRIGRYFKVVGLSLFVFGLASNTLAQADWETILSGHEVNVDREYYEISGSTAEQLLDEMQRKGPSEPGDEERFYATTTSQSSFRYETIKKGSNCSLNSVGVKTDIVVRLPRWSGENDSSELAKAWRAFMKKLLEHEYGHVSISRTGSERMYFSLKALPSAECSTLKEAAQKTVARISDQLQEDNHEYDRATGHGRSQGAVWMVRRKEQ
jgi:predicted secreted Zn-dependent protease